MLALLVIILGIIILIKLVDLSNRIDRLERERNIPTSKIAEGFLTQQSIQGKIFPSAPPAPLKQEILSQKEEVVFVPQDRVEEKSESSASSQELEFKLGGKIFTGIGAIAVTLGVGFFLRYAFENNLITETMRVVLGMFFGLVLLGIGEFTRKKFLTYSQILIGAGLGVLYLSLYSAFGYYHILSQTSAFIGMIGITAAGVLLAIRYDSLTLAIFSQIGGFLTPEILFTRSDYPHTLFLYIAVLDLGIFSVAWKKLWRPLVFVGFFGTALLFAKWFGISYTGSQWAVAEGYATFFFAIFMGVSLVHHLVRKAPQNLSDLSLVTINSGFYFLVSYAILDDKYHSFMGLFTAILAIFHFVLALVARNDSEISPRFKLFLTGIGIVLTTVAVPIQFEKNWITISWAIEALVLIYIGFQMRSKILRLFANGVYTLSFLRLIFFDSQLPTDAVPWLNDRVLSFVSCTLFFILGAVIYRNKKEELEKDEVIAITFLAFLSSVSFLAGGSFEILDFFSHHWLSVFWSMGFAMIFIFAFLIKSLPVRIFAALVSFAALIRLLFVDSDVSAGAHAYFNIRVFLFFVSILSAMFVLVLYRMLSEEEGRDPFEYSIAASAISVYAYILVIWLLSAEILDFHPRYWLPIIWSLIAFLGGWISLKTNMIFLRLAAYFTFLVVFFRLLQFEGNVNLQTYTPFFNSRAAAFIVAVFFMGILFRFLKKYDISTIEKQVASAILFLGANFLLLWLVSVECLDYFRQQFMKLSSDLQMRQRVRYDNLKNVSLSISWAVYSILLLGLGIIKKSKISRLLAIFLFGVVIFKVFLFDTSHLSTLYKFISFLTLGIILLFTGFLYNRYKDRILEFIKA